ncbi:MAG: ABC transporter ATP-binding protein [Candidatus Cloacimonetes bacterium]|nr:ABC transporter ATP-binding protein [Candidatus Cloacimonadota bacterium]
MTTPVISLEHIYFRYSDQDALKDISLEVFPADYLAVIGPNGGGKTTLLKLILGLITPTKGSISVMGTSPAKGRNHIGYVPQYGNYSRSFPLRVKDVVMSGCIQGKSFFPWHSKEIHKKAEANMNLVKILPLAEKSFSELSGGQKQRTLIARALITDPEIILLDEPTASVDSEVERDVYELLKELNQTKTILLVSHDIGFVSQYVNRVMCLNVASCTHPISELKTGMNVHYEGHLQPIHHHCKL